MTPLPIPLVMAINAQPVVESCNLLAGVLATTTIQIPLNPTIIIVLNYRAPALQPYLTFAIILAASLKSIEKLVLMDELKLDEDQITGSAGS